MNVGLLKEDPGHERRVALTPAVVQSLVGDGCSVFVEKGAGEACHFTNEHYENTGAKIVYTRDEVFGRSEVVLKISAPTEQDTRDLHDGQVFLSFLHLAVAKTAIMKEFLAKRICAIGYELIEDESGEMPILIAMSEIAGQRAIQIAARYLESTNNGRGIVMGGVTAIPPATVVVLGAGNVGRSAARMALGVGAEVIVLDRDISRLRRVATETGQRAVTAIVNDYNLKKALRFADVVVGAILIKWEKTPHLISEEMVRNMKPGSIVLDISIDQGGCFETSRPTTLDDPTYILHNVIHFCVPNIPAMVARSASVGLANTMLPFLTEMAEKGIDRAIRENRGLAKGVCTHNGTCTNDSIAKRFELQYGDIGTQTR